VLKSIKAKYVEEALIDAANTASLYEQAASEVAAGIRIEGLWVQALTASEMDEAKAAAWYINERVKLMQLESLSADGQRERAAAHRERQAKSAEQYAIDQGWM
jgi:hypothetical protein